MRQAFSLAMVFAFLAGCAKSAEMVESGVKPESDEKPITIPLADIWALAMPGTKSVKELEPRVFGEQAKNLTAEEREQRLEASFVLQIAYSLRLDRLKKRGKIPDAPEAFAVSGSPMEALREAWSVLAKKKEAPRALPLGSEATVVFFRMSQAPMYIWTGSKDKATQLRFIFDLYRI